MPEPSTLPEFRRVALLYRAAARKELDAEHDEGENQHDVDVGTEGVEANPTQQPEHQQNHKDCPKHRKSPIRKRLPPV